MCDQLTHVLCLLVRAAAIIEERIQRRPWLNATERQLSRFQAAAPPTGSDLAHGDALYLEGFAEVSGLFTAGRREITLGAAVIQPEARWIPSTAICRSMAHQHHLPTGS
jgi:hypothetical protein